MTGTKLVERALQLLGYTTHTGDVDNALNGEEIRLGLPILNQILADLCRIKSPEKEPAQLTNLNDTVPLPEAEAVRVAVPGVAMYLALSRGDSENHNWFMEEYHQRRNSLKRDTQTRRDVQPKVIF